MQAWLRVKKPRIFREVSLSSTLFYVHLNSATDADRRFPCLMTVLLLALRGRGWRRPDHGAHPQLLRLRRERHSAPLPDLVRQPRWISRSLRRHSNLRLSMPKPDTASTSGQEAQSRECGPGCGASPSFYIYSLASVTTPIHVLDLDLLRPTPLLRFCSFVACSDITHANWPRHMTRSLPAYVVQI